ncbi:bifunctional polymyxin resistance protein, ArnA [Artemisia annua]|uniref:Dihydroflavonol 4-reductase n=1 Tax=Artemisia annua TaxID=35608 RepID=A0A2U1PW02_ARTAN|nr:bifunctional polymyxin resistance protein, ArnA [Artemisia annua]
MENKGSCKVCVTGGAGYIGSFLVQLLLQNGYIVHATLRNLGDESKVGLLKSFPFAEERLHLFKADIYNPEEFEEAIQGCVYVFHVATPLFHTTGYKEIADACIPSGTVKRLIYTASVSAASPLKEDGSGYKTIIDKSCWTPLHLDVPYTNYFLKVCIRNLKMFLRYLWTTQEAKTKSEQEALKIGEDTANKLEVVTLCCGLMGGGIVRSGSPSVFVSQISNDMMQYQPLRYLEELLGKVPIVHIDDVCQAHIFCAETPSVNGRFLCASSFVSSAEMAKHYQRSYPQLKQEYLEERGIEIKWGSRKIEDKGFAYKYSTEMILDDCLECAKRSGIV